MGLDAGIAKKEAIYIGSGCPGACGRAQPGGIHGMSPIGLSGHMRACAREREWADRLQGNSHRQITKQVLQMHPNAHDRVESRALEKGSRLWRRAAAAAIKGPAWKWPLQIDTNHRIRHVDDNALRIPANFARPTA